MHFYHLHLCLPLHSSWKQSCMMLALGAEPFSTRGPPAKGDSPMAFFCQLNSVCSVRPHLASSWVLELVTDFLDHNTSLGLIIFKEEMEYR